jgi:hypothetical protein
MILQEAINIKGELIDGSCLYTGSSQLTLSGSVTAKTVPEVFAPYRLRI